MKFLSLLAGLLLSASVSFAQASYPCPGPTCGPVHFDATGHSITAKTFNPFNREVKGTAVKASAAVIQTQRAILTITARPKIYAGELNAGYQILVGEIRYSVVGIGPRTAGIYDVVLGDGEILVYESNFPKAKVWHLRTQVTEVVSTMQPLQAQLTLTELSRLLVFQNNAEYGSNTGMPLTRAMTRNPDGTATYFDLIPHATVDSDGDYAAMPLGIYDFKISPDKKTLTIHMYHITRENEAYVFQIVGTYSYPQ